MYGHWQADFDKIVRIEIGNALPSGRILPIFHLEQYGVGLLEIIGVYWRMV